MVQVNSSGLVGRRLPLLGAEAKASGQARYASDITLPGMLHGKILRSPLPHALLRSIDISKAQKLHGVKAVITGRDTAGIKYGTARVPEGFKDKQGLAMEKVRYIGDAIAAIAAFDEDTALEALEMIKVDYEALPAVFDPEAAMRPGAPQVHDHVRDNVSRKNNFSSGDVDEGFRKAYHIREDRFVTQGTSHVALETHACIALYEPSGQLTVWTATQAPFYVQDDLASTLQIREGQVRVIKPVTGGGFGGKADGMDDNDFCASLLSIKTARPVRIAYTREEELQVTRRRHPAVIILKTAVASDGSILAKDCKLLLDGGAYNYFGGIAPLTFTPYLCLPYRQQAFRYEGIRVYTNKQPSGAMRGYGSPQMHFAQDVQMGLIARDLGIDPQELRLRNGLETGETTCGYHIFSSGFKTTVHKVSEAGSEAPGRVAADGLTGWGLGCSGFPHGSIRRLHPGTEAFSEVIIRANTDGTVTLLTGSSDIGQGSNTALAQIAGEVLGIPLDRIQVVAADTAVTPLDFGSYSSRVTLIAGNAALAAARKLKERLLEAAAQALEANVADLHMEAGRIVVKGSSDKYLLFADAVAAAHKLSEGKSISAQGAFTPAPTHPPTFSFGTNSAQVEIDRETGEVMIRLLAVSHDCGIALNPLAVEGQLQGSVHMGAGYALSENLETSAGQVLNPSLLDYKVLTPLDMPEMKVSFADVEDPVGPFGAKEAGEGAVGPTAPAIANAILQATGIEIHRLPIKPEDVLQALEEKGL